MELGKIQDLLQKCNISKELSAAVVESLVEYRKTTKESLEKEYNTKVEKAKALCESTLEQYKKDLALKVQVFCEAKVSQIENVVAKQAANRETEAAGKLTRIKSMLEGVDLTNGNQIGELKAKNQQLQKIAAQLQEDNKKIVTRSKRQAELTEKIMQRAKLLESRNADLSKKINEGKAITEGKAARGGVTKMPPRKAATPKANEIVLTESKLTPKAAKDVPNGVPTPDQIAAMLD